MPFVPSRFMPRSAAVAVAILCAGLPAAAATFEFLAAPETDLNRVYRLDRATGEIGACQYGLQDGSPVGVTLCYPPGDPALSNIKVP